MKTDFSKAIDIVTDWFIKNRKHIKDWRIIQRLLRKAGFCSNEEIKNFDKYVRSPEGKEEFVRVIRTKAKKAGLRK